MLVSDALTPESRHSVAPGSLMRPAHPSPPPPSSSSVVHRDLDEESLDAWGFKDTCFRFNERGSVELTGARYALCGHELPHFLGWARQMLGIDLDPTDRFAPHYPPAVPAAISNASFEGELSSVLKAGQWTAEPLVRLRHGHGHTQEEVFALKHGEVGRVPDLVVFPDSEAQVVALVKLARRHQVVLVPFGGGTSVTEALRCPPEEQRSIVSVDMKRMNRILSLDRENRTAVIEAGIVGRHLVSELAGQGYTLGHEPDSIEFSTLGGWVATHASGMKKNRYGNIEDLVIDLRVVNAEGELLSRNQAAPRESVGVDPRLWMFGSEGTLGIVTSVTVQLSPLPEVQRYGSVLFPTFADGVAFMYDLTQEGIPPASVRLVDNLQFQFGMALKPASHGWRAKKSALEKFLVTKLKGFDPNQMVAATLVFEGTVQEVTAQEGLLYRIAKRHRGMKAGAENGKRGYQLTYGIAYIRDFILNHYILAESFETSVPWSRVAELCERVKQRIRDEHTRRGLPGKPFVTCRVTQVYPTGAAVYFYFGFYFKGMDRPSQVYAEIEHAAREEVLACGGSLSHHHGVGKIRRGFVPQIMSPAMLDWQRRLKSALDPQNLFGSGNTP